MIAFVATPIGNLKDITLRALEELRAADVIFCEDTRHTVKLLSAYDIKKPLRACHKFNEHAAAEEIAALHGEGEPRLHRLGRGHARRLRPRQYRL